ncbi:hypothetical protein BDY24DRAFT_386431 [Mrakia frigida]|uniref:uncharacterized protein n=1 Tax=Mrakia frigida TaxID=29902 RepID=UPI003FCBF7B4
MAMPNVAPLPPLPSFKKKIKIPPPQDPTVAVSFLSPPPTQRRRKVACSPPYCSTQATLNSNAPSDRNVPPPPVGPHEAQHQHQSPPGSSSSTSSSLPPKIPHKPFDVISCLPPHLRPSAPEPKFKALPSPAGAAKTVGGGGDAGGGKARVTSTGTETTSALEKGGLQGTTESSSSRESWGGFDPYSKNPTSSSSSSTILKSLSSPSATQHQPQQRRTSASSGSSSLTDLPEDSEQLSTPSLVDRRPLPPLTIVGLGSPIALQHTSLPPVKEEDDCNQGQERTTPNSLVVDRPPLSHLSTFGLDSPAAVPNLQLPTPTPARKPRPVEDSDEDEFNEEDHPPCSPSSARREVSRPPSSHYASPSLSVVTLPEEDDDGDVTGMDCDTVGGAEVGRRRSRDVYEAEEEEEIDQDAHHLQALYSNADTLVKQTENAALLAEEAFVRAQEEVEKAKMRRSKVHDLMVEQYNCYPLDEGGRDDDVDMESRFDQNREDDA